MKKANIAGAILGISVVAIAVLSACSDALRAGVEETPEPPLTGLDAAAPEASVEQALCVATDCPSPYATCPDKPGTCTTNLSNDVLHCGSCDMKCPAESFEVRAFFVCKTGRCQMLCRPNSGDCNGLVDDGCEVDLREDPANCGACGNACAPGELCWKGACGCPSGQVVCDGRCVRLSDDAYNCGACGHVCDTSAPDFNWPCGRDVFPANTAVACIDSKCEISCDGGWADCNSKFCADGCETPLGENRDHCGKCDRKCTDEQVCLGGKCLCDPGLTRCLSECVDLQSDASNCGGCGNVCPGAESVTGSPFCDMGRCSFVCAVGYGNCDGRNENGCEVDLTVDPLNCGACGTHCDVAGGQPCAGGKCLTRPCDAGVIN